MKKQSLILTLALVVLTFFGCKPPKEFIDTIKATPNPAEYKGGKIEVVFEGSFPNKYFGKKMTMTVVPVLTTADGKVYKASAVTYQGEKVKDNNDIIKYKVGGKYTQTATWDYVEGMENGVLTAHEIAKLDLRGLDLAVLSACQTGIGELKEDGVFGIQRTRRICLEKASSIHAISTPSRDLIFWLSWSLKPLKMNFVPFIMLTILSSNTWYSSSP